MVSRNGVVYDLEFSPYKITVDEITYHFSSFNHLDKYKELLYKNRAALSLSLSRRFKIEIGAETIADIVLYAKVETRGFFIATKEVKIECQDKVKLDGLMKITKS